MTKGVSFETSSGSDAAAPDSESSWEYPNGRMNININIDYAPGENGSGAASLVELIEEILSS